MDLCVSAAARASCIFEMRNKEAMEVGEVLPFNVIIGESLSSLAHRITVKNLTASSAGASNPIHRAVITPQAASAEPVQRRGLSNESIVKMTKAGLGDDVIIGLVESQPGEFSVDPDSVIGLKQSGVSDRVIGTIINQSVARKPATGPAAPVAVPEQATQFMQSPPPPSLQQQSIPISTSVRATVKPRIFLQSASKGTNWNAARDQSMEMSKDLERDCPGVTITINPQAADYTIILNHIELGLITRDNQIQVANKAGDLLSKTKEGGSIAGGMKKACALIIADWTR